MCILQYFKVYFNFSDYPRLLSYRKSDKIGEIILAEIFGHRSKRKEWKSITQLYEGILLSLTITIIYGVSIVSVHVLIRVRWEATRPLNSNGLLKRFIKRRAKVRSSGKHIELKRIKVKSEAKIGKVWR